jgi:hypothetical protein
VAAFWASALVTTKTVIAAHAMIIRIMVPFEHGGD